MRCCCAPRWARSSQGWRSFPPPARRPAIAACSSSKGVGRQIFSGGSGVAYGTVFSGGSLVITDYSATHDLKVESPVLPTTNADGSRTFAPAGGTRSAWPSASPARSIA